MWSTAFFGMAIKYSEAVLTVKYRYLFVILVFVGAIGNLEAIWALADTMNGLMIIPNLIAILILSPVILEETKKYFSKN